MTHTYRPGDRVEWKTIADEWKPAIVFRLSGSHYLIVLDENEQTMYVRPEHLRQLGSVAPS